jgi:hypothetical protein
MEAWRLPNGVFESTTVGVDVIVMRKEAGESAEISNGLYFEKNPERVLGEYVDGIDRFGKPGRYVRPFPGETIEEAVSRMAARAVTQIPEIGKPTAREKAALDFNAAPEPKPEGKSAVRQASAVSTDYHNVDTTEQFNRKYAKAFEAGEIEAWKATAWNGAVSNPSDYVKSSPDFVKTEAGYMHRINFTSGNIYEKLDSLEEKKGGMEEGEYEKQKAMLLSALPKPKSVTEFSISPVSEFARGFCIRDFDPTVYHYGLRRRSWGRQDVVDSVRDGEKPLLHAFRDWLYSADSRLLGLPGSIGAEDIVNYSIGKRVQGGRDEPPEIAANTRKLRREHGERLFNQYVRENLSLGDRERLEGAWNRRFNATAGHDYSKVPLFVDGIHRTFKKEELEVSPIELRGAAELVNKGNGILAFDVGVGKTMTGILATVSQLQMDRAKRPLFVVPKAVYDNWVSEITDLFPNVTLNRLGNLNGIENHFGKDGKLALPENSLSLCTYEGLEKISFKDETLRQKLLPAIMESQETAQVKRTRQIVAMSAKPSSRQQREAAAEEHRLLQILGAATQSKRGTVFWEDLGFDHITVDEMHNFKNVFSRAKNPREGESANEFSAISGGKPSNRGLKLFAISQLVQDEQNGRNVFGLTATPFQNSPLEIYSMLSFVGKPKLKEAGIYNLHEFMATFADLKNEFAVDTKSGEVVDKTVMKGFKNLQALQGLITEFVDKVSGEEAGVERPHKNTHETRLDMTDKMREASDQIMAYMENSDPRVTPGATLRGINFLRTLALSPALLNGKSVAYNTVEQTSNGPKPVRVTYDFNFEDHVVKSSPKLSFVCDTLSGVYRAHPDKGQVIYMPQGVDRYSEIKDYLAEKGVPKEAVGFITGAVGQDERTEIMRDFNDPKGKIKVIIGSEAIQEGVNLHGNTTTLYDCMLEWNPTANQQVRGRVWR